MLEFIKTFLAVLLTLLVIALLAVTGLYFYLIYEREAVPSTPESSSQLIVPEPSVEEPTETPSPPAATEEPIPEQESTQPETPAIEARYAYRTLTDAQQRLYARYLQALQAMEEGIQVTAEEEAELGGMDLFALFNCVMDDYPELFWVSNSMQRHITSLSNQVLHTDIQFDYILEEASRDAYQQQLETRVDAWLAGVPEGTDEYAKALYIYEQVIHRTDYVRNAPYNQNILSVFLYGESVCNGYAKAAQYMLNRLGMECVTIGGEAVGEGSHAWNLVKVNGEYYYLDPTWGDPVFSNNTMERFENIAYDYFLVTSRDIGNTHVAKTAYPLPDCTATADNYFVRTDRYFTAYDPEAVKALITADITAGLDKSMLRFGGEDVYRQATEALFGQEAIFAMLPAGEEPTAAREIAYTTTDAMQIVTVYFG
ncbi:hypothetical protein LJC63_01705 [Ruminococcaceae bacterium OttesenSCG-928-L11]|nr:hypothetical protein [Ruminococcaceae bacterium OttesenSCG-928-L11]